MPQYNLLGHTRSHYHHIETLLKRELISTAEEKKITDIYVKACRDAEALYAPVVEIVEGVIEILQNIKSTKGLFDAWPECEKFLDLPEVSSGALMKVDVAKLNEALDGFYPPAEKTSGA